MEKLPKYTLKGGRKAAPDLPEDLATIPDDLQPRNQKQMQQG